jgi:hypothetical protein
MITIPSETWWHPLAESVAAIVLIIMQRKNMRDAKDTKVAVLEVVKTTSIIHGLSNSAYGAALRAVAVAKRALAKYSNEQRDIESALEAEKEADEHDAKQLAITEEINRRADIAMSLMKDS